MNSLVNLYVLIWFIHLDMLLLHISLVFSVAVQLHYLRLPKDISEDHVILMDCTVSTGAAAMMAIRVLLVSLHVNLFSCTAPRRLMELICVQRLRHTRLLRHHM